MKSTNILENIEYHEPEPYAQPLLVDKDSRILRWMLKPGQQIAAHTVPDSPFYIVVLQGQGMFSGADGQEQTFGPGALIILEPGESHTVRALDDSLIFVSFMKATDSMRHARIGGEIGHG